MRTRIIILTGNELRHTFFRVKLASYKELEVIRTFCESEQNILDKALNNQVIDLRKKHLEARLQSEKDFFELYLRSEKDNSNPVIVERGKINDLIFHEEIIKLVPDLVIVYGASIIKDPLLSFFKKKIINIHLGLSPYYCGTGTNFWPLVDEFPECVGVTYMYMDHGIDTGEVIHQVRGDINYFDSPSQIGNRLIKKMVETLHELIVNFSDLKAMPSFKSPYFEKVLKNKDFTEESVEKLYHNFSTGMIDNYLKNLLERNGRFPIIENPVLVK